MTTTTAQQKATSLPLATWIILVVLGLGGIALSWGLQLTQGMEITGLGQQVVWGLYIAGFFTAMGAGSFLVLLAGLSEFNPLIPPARRRNILLLALACLVIGALLIAMDVGNPLNLWRILTAGQLNSMMTWDFLVLLITGILALVYLAVIWKQAASNSTSRTIAVVAGIGALFLVVVEGWMLSSMAARPLWGGALMVVSFLAAALVAGISIALLAWPDLNKKLGGWLKMGLWATLAIVTIEVLTALLAKEVRPYQEVSQLLAGAFSSMFWVYLVAGLLIPLGILLWSKDLLWLRVAAGLALLGVIAEKLWLLAAGQALPWISIPAGSYVPTWVEFVGIAGAIALCILIYRIMILVLRIEK